MAKSPKPKPKKKPVGGPFLAAAVFCDSVLEEKPGEGKAAGASGVISAIRIFDTVTVALPAAPLPGTVPGIQLNALITFRAGDATGKHTVQLVSHAPDGEKATMPLKEFKFPGTGHRGFNLRLTLGVQLRLQGLHWFDVLLNGRLVTRMPLMISYRQPEAEHPAKQTPSQTRK